MVPIFREQDTFDGYGRGMTGDVATLPMRIEQVFHGDTLAWLTVVV